MIPASPLCSWSILCNVMEVSFKYVWFSVGAALHCELLSGVLCPRAMLEGRQTYSVRHRWKPQVCGSCTLPRLPPGPQLFLKEVTSCNE